jgi:hypothetical protein
MLLRVVIGVVVGDLLGYRHNANKVLSGSFIEKERFVGLGGCTL